MYFWKVESLKKDILKTPLTDKELIPYVVGSACLYILGLEVNIHAPSEVNIWTYVQSILHLIITPLGIIYVYKKNGGSNGDHFASKYFSIGFVVAIRFLIYFIPLLLLMTAYFAAMFAGKEKIPTTYVEVIVINVWNVLFYYRFAKHIGDTSQASKAYHERDNLNKC